MTISQENEIRRLVNVADRFPLTRRRIVACLTVLAVGGVVPSRWVLAESSDAGSTASERPKRVFITGSSAGLGLMAARLLVKQGLRVVLHGRSPARASDAMKAVPGAEAALHGDFESLAQVHDLAKQANDNGHFDAIIHNAGIGDDETSRALTQDGYSRVFQINVLAPYVLTALIVRPQRLIYMTTGMQMGADGETSLGDPLWAKRPWNGSAAYSESKLLLSMLAFTVAERWRDVLVNTVEPGWVPTRMGGPSATDDINQGHLTQSWLAVSGDAKAQVTGENFYHMALQRTNPDSQNPEYQARLLAVCGRLSGVSLPA